MCLNVLQMHLGNGYDAFQARTSEVEILWLICAASRQNPHRKTQHTKSDKQEIARIIQEYLDTQVTDCFSSNSWEFSSVYPAVCIPCGMIEANLFGCITFAFTEKSLYIIQRFLVSNTWFSSLYWEKRPVFAAFCKHEPKRQQNMYIYSYLELVYPLFWGLNPPKEGPFHSKQGSFGFSSIVSPAGRPAAC